MPAERKQLTPVLIIPGFMSSVLTVQSSTLQPSWKDHRIWLNITTLGFNLIKRGGKLQRNEERRSIRLSNRMLNAERSGKKPSAEEEEEDSLLEQMHSEYVKQVECKNKWVQHMKLDEDLVSERKGVVVRALQGTAAVDYLVEGALAENMSYVFGPVLKVLRAVGYKDGVNLDAAPYDWRIPPSVLETRDKYFTKTIEKIEQLYHYNDNTPVVILSHSMGCRASHYLFNFVLHTKGVKDGMEWLAKYINCWVPVGAPHIGAPTSVRCMMDGDKMGLDAFLSDYEGLSLARSFGSPAWLFPLEKATSAVPQSNDSKIPVKSPLEAPMATSFIRDESALYITIPPQRVNLEDVLEGRKISYPTKLRLAIRLGKSLTIKTNHFNINQHQRFIDFNNETWIVPCPLDIENTAKLYSDVQVLIEKPGGLPKRQTAGICDCGILWPVRCLRCLLKWILCLPCAILCRFFYIVGSQTKKGVKAALGSYAVLGESEPFHLGRSLLDSRNKTSDSEEGKSTTFDIEVELKAHDSDDPLCTSIWKLLWFHYPHSEKMTINFKFELKSMNVWTKPVPINQKSQNYIACQTEHLFDMEGMKRVLQLLQNVYESDPVAPFSQSSWHPPPVKRVVSIYGINYPSEVAAVYRRNPIKHIPNLSNPSAESSELEATFVLDEDATLDKQTSKTHTIKRGIIFETSKSPQTVIAEDGTSRTEFKSGDGSVPYWSLQHCRLWQGQGPAECDVTVHEIDSVEHRAILDDSRFHKLLLDLLGCDELNS